MKAFKIQVNPEQSRIVQEEMFKRGWKWIDFNPKSFFTYLNVQYLYFNDDKTITCDVISLYLYAKNLPELTFEQFKQQYMETLEIKKSRVIEAAKTSPEAEKLLAKLFPEVIKKDKSVEVPSVDIKIDGMSAIQKRISCEYEDKAFYLSNSFDWRIERDSGNCLCLIPTKK